MSGGRRESAALAPGYVPPISREQALRFRRASSSLMGMASYGTFPHILTNPKPAMLAKRTVKNQITLPKAIASQFPDVEYFEVRTENQRIILEPLRHGQADAVRKKLGL